MFVLTCLFEPLGCCLLCVRGLLTTITSSNQLRGPYQVTVLKLHELLDTLVSMYKVVVGHDALAVGGRLEQFMSFIH